MSRISSFVSNDNGVTLAANSESILLTLNQPEDNHNGGNIAFGPDGYLYVGFGDGGGGGDQHGTIGNGQRLTTLLGKMLRIDVNGAAPYAMPSSNPFFSRRIRRRCPAGGRSSGNCPEIYAYGFRNPWRWSFDRSSGELWVGDVGQGDWEEVDRVQRGGNYGWRCREGAHDYNTSGTPACSAATLIDPVAEYDHTLGASITGGYVYRGSQNTPLVGRYVFGDFGSGRIFAWIAENATQPRQPTQLLDTGPSIASFGAGQRRRAVRRRLRRAVSHRVPGRAAAVRFRATLSATGCVNPGDATATRCRPDSLRSQRAVLVGWRRRRIAGSRCPTARRIVRASATSDWDFPNGTVLREELPRSARGWSRRACSCAIPTATGAATPTNGTARQTDATLAPGRRGAHRQRPDSGLPERSSVPRSVTPLRRAHAGSANRATESQFHVSADGAQRATSCTR